MTLDELDHKELALLKSALLAYRDCPNCAREYSRTHSIVSREALPKIRKIANRRFESLTILDQQLKFLDNKKEEAV